MYIINHTHVTAYIDFLFCLSQIPKIFQSQSVQTMTSLAVVEEITLKPKTSRALSTTHGGWGKAIVGFFGEAEAAGAGEKFLSSANSRAEEKANENLCRIVNAYYH